MFRPLSLLTGLFALLAVVLRPIPAAEATLPGTNGLIAFSSEVSGERHIWTMDANGGNRQQLTTGSHIDRTPSWSPDGTKVVYRAQYDNGPPVGGLRIKVIGDPGDDGIAGTEMDFLPRFDTSGNRLVFEEDRGGGNFDVVVMDLSNDHKTNLTELNGMNDHSPVFSPNGTQIAFISESPGSSDVWIMDDVANPQPVKISNTPADIKSTVDFSPDGKTLVFDFTSDSGVTNHIAKVNVDGSSYLQLTTGNNVDASPKFSPDGQHILFERQTAAAPNVSLPQGPAFSSQVMVMNTDGTGVQPLSAAGALDFSPEQQSVPHAAATIVWGDNDCSGTVTVDDARLTLRKAAVGKSPAQSACAYALEEIIGTTFGVEHFGDVNCGGAIDPFDVLLILKQSAGFTSNQQDCPQAGNDVQVTR
jgi:dipeptidyl aminopeptidase/acylaminoacyl peptidase